MKNTAYVYWHDGEMWLGYLEEYPDYLTQGESLADLEEHLRDIYQDVTSGKIPHVRRRAELSVA
ncbi:MAG: type II toxin-antitoxin system HicB family antitoxin [Verrucomicrobia bacterium]|nr:type II toxin-antitoxin system HicB family antitoxin [Verrucomicrobiota bacterium]